MVRWIRWLDDIEAADAQSVGGKIAQLGRLRSAGAAVPTGFAVVAAAYTETVHCAGLTEELRRRSRAAVADPASAASIAADCAHLVAMCEPPEAVVKEVVDAYARLTLLRRQPLPPVAVRSSALAEDGTQASGAGQYESFLGVSGPAAVMAAVQRCWASLFSERALLYRARHGIDVDASPMAVGVVELIDARSSGVAFSLHPVTGRPDRLVVESTFGWGEPLVQGRVTPDRYEVDRSDLRILKRQIGRKTRVSTWGGAGIIETAMPDVLVDEPSLSDDEVRRLCQTLLEVEEILDHFVDLEWVWPHSGGAPIVVQARAETVHRSSRASVERPDGFEPVANALRHAFAPRRP